MMKTPRERYFNDPQFHSLVDMMTAMIHRCEFTPSEMREAAILASIKYEETYIRGISFLIPEVEEALDRLHRYTDGPERTRRENNDDKGRE